VMGLGAAVLAGDPGGAGEEAGGQAGDEAGEALSVRAVLLDTAADAAAAAGVAVTGAIILATGGLYWLDPVVALIVALVIAYQARGLVGEALALARPLPRGRRP
ncbi:MAG: cation transporter, partial [Acidimicrobiales bacterium]